MLFLARGGMKDNLKIEQQSNRFNSNLSGSSGPRPIRRQLAMNSNGIGRYISPRVI